MAIVEFFNFETDTHKEEAMKILVFKSLSL